MDDSLVVQIKSDQANDDGAEVWTVSEGNHSPVLKDPRRRTPSMEQQDADDDPPVEPAAAAAAAASSLSAASVESIDLKKDSSTAHKGARRRGQVVMAYPKFTRLNLTALPVRSVTTRWDKFDEDAEINASAAAATNNKELPEHPKTCWWFTVSSMLTVLFYSVCFGTIPAVFFILAYYFAWTRQQYEENHNGQNGTDPGVSLLP